MQRRQNRKIFPGFTNFMKGREEVVFFSGQGTGKATGEAVPGKVNH
jgi:hypothetical protein